MLNKVKTSLNGHTLVVDVSEVIQCLFALHIRLFQFLHLLPMLVAEVGNFVGVFLIQRLAFLEFFRQLLVSLVLSFTLLEIQKPSGKLKICHNHWHSHGAKAPPLFWLGPVMGFWGGVDSMIKENT